MPTSPESLYQLLPAIHRVRDAQRGEPLRHLLSLIAREAGVLEENLEQLHDDQFIETCAPWVIPYLGDLVGWQPLHTRVPGVASPRAEVANTLAYRRRKGTAAMLEQLARDVTGWDASVVEFFQRLATTQYLNHLRPECRGTPDFRHWEPLARVGTPFDAIPRTINVRRIPRNRGRHNIPNVGIFLWRLQPHRHTQSVAVPLPGDPARLLIHPASVDAPLFTRPTTEASLSTLAHPLHVPAPIARDLLAGHLADYYGPGRSLLLETLDVDASGNVDPEATPVPVPIADIRVSRLDDVLDSGGNVIGWTHLPADGVAVDPELGRIAFPSPPGKAVLVTFHRGFSADLGGGEYERASSFSPGLVPVVGVTQPEPIQAALDTVTAGGAVEISDSGRHAGGWTLQADPGAHIELRAANGAFPAVTGPAPCVVDAGADADVSLNGLLFVGTPLVIRGSPRRVRIVHCTLVPGSLRDESGSLIPLLQVEADTEVVLERSIVGAVSLPPAARLVATASILDAGSQAAMACAGPGASGYGGPLQLAQCTVFGRIRSRILESVSNCILLATADPGTPPVDAERLQEGCVRYSHIPSGSRTPRRHRCQPASPDEALRLAPQFTSLRYADPGYLQLSDATAREIREGADDGAEMGAFHDLFQPQREGNLRVRLSEYLRVGLEAGILHAT